MRVGRKRERRNTLELGDAVIIRDPLYNYIYLTAVEQKIVDSVFVPASSP